LVLSAEYQVLKQTRTMLRFLRTKDEAADDATLLSRFKEKGDKQALACLFDRYLELIYGLCVQYLKSTSLAEDAVMSIYAELQEKVPNHDIRNFKNWLFTFVRNHCLMQLRKDKKMPTQHFDPTFMHSEENVHPVIEETVDNERQSALNYCLEQLSTQQKTCVQLFYYEGHSYKEIAIIREEPVGTIRSFIQNGRRNLKKCIEKRESEQ